MVIEYLFYLSLAILFRSAIGAVMGIAIYLWLNSYLKPEQPLSLLHELRKKPNA